MGPQIRLALFCVVFAAIAFPVMAGPDRLAFSVGSIHTEDEDDKFTPFNPGVFVVWDQPAYSAGAGVFINSYSDAAFSFVGSVPFYRGEKVTLSVFGAFAWYPNGSRFGLSFGNWVPGLGLEARTDRFFAQVFPSTGDVLDAVITFGVTVPFPGTTE